MGCDIHWIIERKHSDGRWEAVAEKYNIYELTRSPETGRIEFNHPWNAIGDRNYHRFGIFSEVRYVVPDQVDPLAYPGLPEDASPFAAHNLSEDDPDLHSHGWFLLDDLIEAIETDPRHCAPAEDDKAVLKAFQDILRVSIEGIQRMPIDNILALDGESNHAALERTVRQKDLLPVGRNTLRMLISYDN